MISIRGILPITASMKHFKGQQSIPARLIYLQQKTITKIFKSSSIPTTKYLVEATDRSTNTHSCNLANFKRNSDTSDMKHLNTMPKEYCLEVRAFQQLSEKLQRICILQHQHSKLAFLLSHQGFRWKIVLQEP